MKTCVILSDTHGKKTFDEIMRVLEESDYIFHLGDTSGDGAKIRNLFPDKTILLNGNCDPIRLGENTVVKRIEDVSIFATHGHLYSVKGSSRAALAEAAKAAGCKIALYGHTHRAAEEDVNGVACLNPGAMTRFSSHSYGYLVINGDKFTYTIVNL